MRPAALATVIVVAACHSSPHAQPDAAQPPVDVAVYSDTCTAAAGTAHVTATDAAGAHTFARLDAGAVWEIGPVAPVTAAPMQVSLWIIDADPVTINDVGSCGSQVSSGCTLDGMLVTTGTLDAGAEVGTHDVTITRFGGASYTLPGTLTITEFASPFPDAPGQITGSISASDGTHSIDGTIGNAFCPALLAATI